MVAELRAEIAAKRREEEGVEGLKAELEKVREELKRREEEVGGWQLERGLAGNGEEEGHNSLLADKACVGRNMVGYYGDVGHVLAQLPS